MAEPPHHPAASSTLNLRDSHPHMVAAVRRWANAELNGLGQEILGDILLVITELVSNAYDHGGGPSSVRLTRSHGPWLVIVEVEDANELLPTIGVSRFGAASHRGNGLVLVDKLATTWGITRHQHTAGKTVWARFTRKD
ncbi:ATP-binding protein [Actinophytocola sp.]|uniref:ATP-binding protein n=1 Tax=Actinophytocola sp. TaxID=1872138 RepID=UPI00389A0BB4